MVLKSPQFSKFFKNNIQNKSASCEISACIDGLWHPPTWESNVQVRNNDYWLVGSLSSMLWRPPPTLPPPSRLSSLDNRVLERHSRSTTNTGDSINWYPWVITFAWIITPTLVPGDLRFGGFSLLKFKKGFFFALPNQTFKAISSKTTTINVFNNVWISPTRRLEVKLSVFIVSKMVLFALPT